MKTTMCTFLLILITLLLFVCQSVNAQTEEVSKLNKALIRAAFDGDSIEAEALLQAGADVDAKSSSGRTALMLAAMRGHTEVVQLLLDAGTDVETKSISGETALTYAVKQGHTEVVQLLLDAGADVNVQDINKRRTALMWASNYGKLEIVNLLIEAGADVNAKMDNGATALSMAISKEHKEVESLLRNAGAKE